VHTLVLPETQKIEAAISEAMCRLEYCRVDTNDFHRQRAGMKNPERSRIHTLDGWRGIAILFVLAEHATRFTSLENRLPGNLGSFGVDVFFVISGYIITARFLEERKQFSTISLRSFYVRRVFRILPLVIAYLSTLCLLSLFVRLIVIRPSEIAGALFFFRNYQVAAHFDGLFTSHFWSLSIEEHFYLLWPALLLFLGNKRALYLAIVSAVFCGFWRIYLTCNPYSESARALAGAVARNVWRTDARFDGLMLGCAAAILLTYPAVKSFVFRNFPKELPLLLGMFLLLNLTATDFWPTTATYVLVTVMLASSLVVEEGLAHNLLNTRILVWIGTISYSVYIWQELFLVRFSKDQLPLGWLSALPLNLVAVFAVSSLSYYFLERPCISLGKRLAQRWCGRSSSPPAHLIAH
jgi:peptidoglycan/LPS O-acetylase OafA/YrhL